MDASVIYNPLQDNKIILIFFGEEGTYLKLQNIYKGEKNSGINTSRMQNIEIVD